MAYARAAVVLAAVSALVGGCGESVEQRLFRTQDQLHYCRVENENLTRDLHDANETIRQLRSDLQAADEEKAQAVKEVQDVADKLKGQVDGLHRDLTEARAQLANARSEINALKKTLQDLSQRARGAEGLKDQVETLQQTVQARDATVAQLRRQIDELEKLLEEARQEAENDKPADEK